MTTISPLHSEEGRKLLDLIDRLRLLPSISHEVALPQIVVVGQQSSGKSSVLKALSNIEFPTNSGLCTQFATEIICRREATESVRAFIIPESTIDDNYRSRLDSFSRLWKDIRPGQDVSDIIDSAREVMGLDDHKRISRDKLRLEFSGPDQDHISLIDLPGLFEQELPGQRESDKMLVDEMILEYIGGDQTIVLAVVSGAYDVQVQRIFRMFEPYSQRTMGIITAPDLVESGTARAATFRQLVTNSSFKAGHEWHVLRNLSHREEQEGKDRERVEEAFFASCLESPDNAWYNIPESQLGIHSLKSKLAVLLQASITEGLPHIQSQLRSASRMCEKGLERLGVERATTEQQRDYLAEKSEKLREHTMKALNGANDAQSLRSRIRIANDQFAADMENYGASWEFVREGETGKKKSLPNEVDSLKQPPQTIYEREWLAIMLDEIRNSRGRELDGLIDPVWVGRMFLRQSRKWKMLAENHTEVVFLIVEQYFQETVEKVIGSESAPQFMSHAIGPELDRRSLALKQKVAELLTPFSSENIRTLNRAFRSQPVEVAPVVPKGSEKKTLQSDMVCHYATIMIEYYRIALNVFVDNMESLAVENVLLGGLEDIMTANKAYKMKEELVSALASESDETVIKRCDLEDRKKDYEEGSRIISRHSIRNRILPASTIGKVSQSSISAETGTPKIEIDGPRAQLGSSVDNVPSRSLEEPEFPSFSWVTAERLSPRSQLKFKIPRSRSPSTNSNRSTINDGLPQIFGNPTPSASSTPVKEKPTRRNIFEIPA